MRIPAVIMFLLLGLVPRWSGHWANAAEAGFPEYKLKAALLFNFAKFTAWPTNAFPSPTAPIKIGILGKDPFGDALAAAIEDKTLGGRSLVLEAKQLDDDLSDCQILFVSRSEKGRLPEILAWLGEKPVLTISEIDSFAQGGGMIQFKVEQRLKFEINASAVEAAGLRISSKLGALGVLVKSTPLKR